MQTPLQEFEQRITGADGERYSVHLYGRSRPADTWQGWLVYVRERDNRRFATPVETTQPNAEAIVYWGSGLTETYLDGALQRALNPPAAVAPAPTAPFDLIEQGVMLIFQRLREGRVLVQRVLDELPFSNADIVRAIEDLEGHHRLLVRRTEEGNDWLLLTDEGRVATRLHAEDEARA